MVEGLMDAEAKKAEVGGEAAYRTVVGLLGSM